LTNGGQKEDDLDDLCKLGVTAQIIIFKVTRVALLVMNTAEEITGLFLKGDCISILEYFTTLCGNTS